MKTPIKMLVHKPSGMQVEFDHVMKILADAEHALGLPAGFLDQTPPPRTATEIHAIEKAEAEKRWQEYKAKHNIS